MPCRQQYIGDVHVMSDCACVTARQARARASPEAAKGPAAAALPEAGLGSPLLREATPGRGPPPLRLPALLCHSGTRPCRQGRGKPLNPKLLNPKPSASLRYSVTLEDPPTGKVGENP